MVLLGLLCGPLGRHPRRPQVFGVVRPQSGYALRELFVADRDQLDVTFKVRGHNPVSDRVRPRSAQLGDAGSWSAARTAPWRRPRAGGATFAGHRRGEPSCRDIQRTHVVASGSSWPGDPVSSAGQVLTAGPHPPAALAGSCTARHRSPDPCSVPGGHRSPACTAGSRCGRGRPRRRRRTARPLDDRRTGGRHAGQDPQYLLPHR